MFYIVLLGKWSGSKSLLIWKQKSFMFYIVKIGKWSGSKP